MIEDDKRVTMPKAPIKTKKKGASSKKRKELKFFVECKKPIEDGIMNAQDFEAYLQERIKVRKLFAS